VHGYLPSETFAVSLAYSSFQVLSPVSPHQLGGEQFLTKFPQPGPDAYSPPTQVQRGGGWEALGAFCSGISAQAATTVL
jgi:hypothetical protein